MDVYIKRDYVMQALTYVGTAEATDIIPLTLAAARNNVMKLPCRELEEIISQEIIENAKAEVAREIFEEIEKVIGNKYDYYVFDNRDIEGIEQDAIIAFADAMKKHFTKLKKKYSEEGG